MSVYSRIIDTCFWHQGAEAINHELKKELTQCQVALADCRIQHDEVLSALKRLHERFESCSEASYTRVYGYSKGWVIGLWIEDCCIEWTIRDNEWIDSSWEGRTNHWSWFLSTRIGCFHIHRGCDRIEDEREGESVPVANWITTERNDWQV